jgi:hypothetical protein
MHRFERWSLAMRRITTATGLLSTRTRALTLEPSVLLYFRKAEGRKLAVELWDVWAGAPAGEWGDDSRPSKALWGTAARTFGVTPAIARFSTSPSRSTATSAC